MEKQLSGVENQIGFAREIMNLYTWSRSEQTNGSGKYSEHIRLCKCIKEEGKTKKHPNEN